ncbi:Senecionine N-oxygenase [Halotydeus destructor]|nr:Senecionine N-oxygenase [Halotydeus destructor]
MSTEGNGRPKKVCIIGAGAAGLCAARHLLTHEDKFVFVVFEQTEQVGGTWVYHDEVGTGKDGRKIHSSMYKNLRTNIPLNVMSFPDFPCKPDGTTFVWSRISARFRHQVTKVKKLEGDKWEVHVTNLDTGASSDSIYDAIFVCNGRYSVPNIPDGRLISDLDTFKGETLHTHDYRISEPYRGKRVVVLGAGPSGIDIAVEVADVAQQVYLCHQLPSAFPDLPGNMTQILSTIVACDEDKVIMKSGDVLENIDCIIFATGYLYDFGFLDDNCDIRIDNGRIVGVYQHLVNISAPTMAIWAVPLKILPFPLYHQQVLFFIKSLTGEMTLPSKPDMLKHVEADLKRRSELGLAERHAHKMFYNLMWDYHDELVEQSKIEPIDPVIRAMFISLSTYRQDILHYKKLEFDIVDKQAFRVTWPDGRNTIVEIS